MLTAVAGFLAAFAVAAATTPLAMWLARRLGVMDAAESSSRKVHRGRIARLGGLAIITGFYAALAIAILVRGEVVATLQARWVLCTALLIGGSVIAALGIYDDVIGADARKKFLVQFLVAGTVCALGVRIDAIVLPLAGKLDLGPLGALVTIVWIVGIINAVNLIDGLDGLASGVSLLAATTLFVVAGASDNLPMMLFMACLAGSIAGFLPYNFNPARIFMGDSGSLFLGYILAVTAIETNMKTSATVALVTPILVLGVPIADTLLAMARRFVRGEQLFHADREHLHHQLLDRGFSHRGAVLVIYAVSAALCTLAGAVSIYGGAPALVSLFFAAAILGWFVRHLGWLEPARWRHWRTATRERRAHNLRLRSHLKTATLRLREATDGRDAWNNVVPLLAELGVVRACVAQPQLAPGDRELLSWSRSEIAADTAHTVRVYPLPVQLSLELSWHAQPRLGAMEESVLTSIVRGLSHKVSQVAPVASGSAPAGEPLPAIPTSLDVPAAEGRMAG
jgi:UDP-GlcNAc:undecaprenyl-phosphate GlcNAc-1-phosphate transferase